MKSRLVYPRIHVVSFQFDGSVETFQCFIRAAEFFKGNAAVVPYLFISLINFKNFIVAGESVFKSVKGVKSGSHVVERLCVLRVDVQRFFVVCDFILVPPEFIHGNAHEIVGFIGLVVG